MIHATTEFQALVWDATRLIPAGEVRTYGEIAQQVGRSSATRAVGNALMPLSFDDNDGVPWWRVVLADGRLNRAEYEEQWPESVARVRDRLVEEGVAFTHDGRVAGIAGRALVLDPLAPANRRTEVVTPTRRTPEPTPCWNHKTVQYSCRDCAPSRR